MQTTTYTSVAKDTTFEHLYQENRKTEYSENVIEKYIQPYHNVNQNKF